MIVIARHFRVTIEEALPNPQDINAREEHDSEADAENDSQLEHGVGVLVDDGKKSDHHTTVSRIERVSHWATISVSPRLFCEIQVVAIAADAPFTEPRTPANPVMTFASTMLIRRLVPPPTVARIELVLAQEFSCGVL